MATMFPLIGIPCCVKAVGIFGMPNHAVSDHYIHVVSGPVRAIPLALPAIGEAMSVEILPRLDGLMLTGSRSNVCPTYYDGPAHSEGTPEDLARDATTLPLIRAAIAMGLPVLAICRGLQELNVALGGSLDQRIQDLPGRMDHSTPSEQAIPKVRTGKAHAVRVEPGSMLDRLWSDLPDAEKPVMVNSLHNQGIARLSPRLIAEAWAPDGTVEGVRVADARGFAMGVQWHPEYDWQTDARSRRLFEAFGAAATAWAAQRDHRGAGKLAAD